MVQHHVREPAQQLRRTGADHHLHLLLQLHAHHAPFLVLQEDGHDAFEAPPGLDVQALIITHNPTGAPKVRR
jgi:hypothetical protein